MAADNICVEIDLLHTIAHSLQNTEAEEEHKHAQN